MGEILEYIPLEVTILLAVVAYLVNLGADVVQKVHDRKNGGDPRTRILDLLRAISEKLDGVPHMVDQVETLYKWHDVADPSEALAPSGRLRAQIEKIENKVDRIDAAMEALRRIEQRLER